VRTEVRCSCGRFANFGRPMPPRRAVTARDGRSVRGAQAARVAPPHIASTRPLLI
jgi:hypothetical protein